MEPDQDVAKGVEVNIGHTMIERDYWKKRQKKTMTCLFLKELRRYNKFITREKNPLHLSVRIFTTE